MEIMSYRKKRKEYDIWYDVFVNCIWVVTLWQ